LKPLKTNKTQLKRIKIIKLKKIKNISENTAGLLLLFLYLWSARRLLGVHNLYIKSSKAHLHLSFLHVSPAIDGACPQGRKSS